LTCCHLPTFPEMGADSIGGRLGSDCDAPAFSVSSSLTAAILSFNSEWA